MNNMIVWSPGVTLENIEKQVIVKAYDYFKKNKTSTSIALGISIRTLDSKLEKYKDDDRIAAEKLADTNKRNADYLRRARGIVGQSISLKEAEAMLSGPHAGIRLEPAAQAAAQPSMPVPERAQVQKVLSGQTAQGGPRRGR